MKYVLFALLCSLSIAQAMEKSSSIDRKALILTAIEKEKKQLQTDLTLLKTSSGQGSEALFQASLAQHRTQSSLDRITNLSTWAQESNSDYKEILRAFTDYQQMNDRLKTKMTKALATATSWNERATQPTSQPKAVAPRVLAPLAEATEEDEEELVKLTIPTRSQSVGTTHTMNVGARRSFSAPVKLKYKNPLSTYKSPFSAVDESDEDIFHQHQTTGAFGTLFNEQISIV